MLVNGDAQAEYDETFFVDLTNPNGATIVGGGRGMGTIKNDDKGTPTESATDAAMAAWAETGSATDDDADPITDNLAADLALMLGQ